MKAYPLEIETAHDDSQRRYMSKGHHDAEAFMAAVRAYGETEPMSHPTHHLVKRVPCSSGEFAYLNQFVEPGTRGAFPATYCFEHGSVMYKAPVDASSGDPV